MSNEFQLFIEKMETIKKDYPNAIMTGIDIESYKDPGWNMPSNLTLRVLAMKHLKPQVLKYMKRTGADITPPFHILGYKCLFAKWANGENAFFAFFNPSRVTCDSNWISFEWDTLLVRHIETFGRKKGISLLEELDPHSFTDLYKKHNVYMQYVLNLDEKAFFKIRHCNSILQFIKAYKKLNRKRNFADSTPYRRNYSQIRIFASIYWNEVKIIADVFKNSVKKSELSLHDMGSLTGYFAVLLSHLPSRYKEGVSFQKIFFSDKDFDDENLIGLNPSSVNEDFPFLNAIERLSVDILDTSCNYPETDINVLNDVLEHLKDISDVELALDNIWSKTKSLLMIHVPFEDIPEEKWGHHISFNTELLRKLGSRFADGEFLSDNYYIGSGRNKKLLTEQGYLIVKRK